MQKRIFAVPVAVLAGLAALAGGAGTAAAAVPGDVADSTTRVTAVGPAAANGWHLHLTFPQDSEGLRACLANVNYYTNNPQYPEVRRNECRNGPGRYEHWWYIDA
jgi:hypothetical protein